MAKVKDEEKGESFNIKDYDNYIVSAATIRDNPRMVVPIGTAFDIGLGGGIAEGTIGVICGKEKCGKTCTCLQIAANCQKKENGKRKVIYDNIEFRLEKKNLLGIEGLDVDAIGMIESTPERRLTAEMHLALCEESLIRYPRCLLIIDSVSALCSDTEFVKGYDESVRDSTGKLQSRFFRRITDIVKLNKNIVICMTHLIANPGGYGAPFMEKTSSALKYFHDWKVMADKKPEYWLDGKKRIGQKTVWKVLNSYLGTAGEDVESWIRYDHGIDCVKELVILAIDTGLIEKKGAWYSLKFLGKDGEDYVRKQGEDGVYVFIRENKDVLAKLKKTYKDMIV